MHKQSKIRSIIYSNIDSEWAKDWVGCNESTLYVNKAKYVILKVLRISDNMTVQSASYVYKRPKRMNEIPDYYDYSMKNKPQMIINYAVTLQS